MFSAEGLAAFLGQWGIFALLGSLIISILVAIAGVMPSIFVTGANVILFGSFYGFLISWAGEVIGAGVSFYLYRLGFKKQTERLGVKYTLIEKITHSGGRRAGWLIFQARLLPFIPSGVVTLAGAVSNLDIKTFLLATAFGKVPSLALETMVSYDLINVGKNWVRLVFTAIALVLLFIVLRKK